MRQLILTLILMVSASAFAKTDADTNNLNEILKSTVQEMHATQDIAQRKIILQNFVKGLEAESILLADEVQTSDYSIRVYQVIGIAFPAAQLACPKALTQIQTLCTGKDLSDLVKSDIKTGKELIGLVCPDSATQETLKNTCVAIK